MPTSKAQSDIKCTLNDTVLMTQLKETNFYFPYRHDCCARITHFFQNSWSEKKTGFSKSENAYCYNLFYGFNNSHKTLLIKNE